MGEFLSFALPQIPSGCTFALVAVGLVLTFRATGVLNFAFGAEAYAAATIYAELYWHGVPPWLAALIVVLVIAPVAGGILDIGLFSRIPRGNTTARVIVSLGIMVMLPQVVQLFIGVNQIYGPPPPFFAEGVVGRWGTLVFNGPECSTLVCTVVVLVGLTLALRTKGFGLPLRAAVESPKLLELNGVNSRYVSTVAWMLSTSLTALAGVLYAAQPQNSIFQFTDFDIVLVAAIAAAAIGAMRSMSLAVIGGISLGIAWGEVQGYLPSNSIWYEALVPSLPFFILLALLVFHPGMRNLEQSSDPMLGVEPPPPPLALALRPPTVSRVVRRWRWPLLAVGLLAAIEFVSAPWINYLTLGASLAIIFLSVTLMTGVAGQLSLAQAFFAGIGACTTAQLVDAQHVEVLLAAAAGALVAGIGGVVASLPALRLRGLPIALLTLCLALLGDYLLFPTSWIGNGNVGLVVPRPHLFGIRMNAIGSRSYFMLVVVVMLLVTGVVYLMARGTTGRALAATHASPVGALSSGVPVRRITIILFFLSAAIAGLGGAFYSMTLGAENPENYVWYFGPMFLVIVVTVGATTVEGAIEAGFGFALLNAVVADLPSRLGGGSGSSSSYFTVLLLSVGAFTYATHPEGIVEAIKRWFALVVLRARPHNSSLARGEEASVP